MHSTSSRPAPLRYGHTVRLAGVDFQAARARAVDALAQEGFGILTEIDVEQTLKKKLGVDFRRYVILGACNPQLAHRGLQAELGLGLLLPCNVCVWEDDGASVVAVLRPDLMVEVAGNERLRAVGEEADQRLRRAMANLQPEAAP